MPVLPQKKELMGKVRKMLLLFGKVLKSRQAAARRLYYPTLKKARHFESDYIGILDLMGEGVYIEEMQAQN